MCPKLFGLETTYGSSNSLTSKHLDARLSVITANPTMEPKGRSTISRAFYTPMDAASMDRLDPVFYLHISYIFLLTLDHWTYSQSFHNYDEVLQRFMVPAAGNLHARLASRRCRSVGFWNCDSGARCGETSGRSWRYCDYHGRQLLLCGKSKY